MPRVIALFFAIFLFVSFAEGYSVITHIAIIDSSWAESIVPVLQKRFPNATPEETFYSDPSKIVEPKQKKRRKLMDAVALLRSSGSLQSGSK
jgi:hypothetical protein